MSTEIRQKLNEAIFIAFEKAVNILEEKFNVSIIWQDYAIHKYVDTNYDSMVDINNNENHLAIVTYLKTNEKIVINLFDGFNVYEDFSCTDKYDAHIVNAVGNKQEDLSNYITDKLSNEITGYQKTKIDEILYK